MKMTFAALALMGLGVAPLAAAQTPACPPKEKAVQIALNNYYLAIKPDAQPEQILPRVEDIVRACSTEPYTLKIAAMTFATIKSADAHTAVARLARAREIFRLMWVSLKGSNPPILAMAENNSPFYVGFDDLYQTETQVLKLLFTAEQFANELAPEQMTIGKGAPMRACEQGDYIDAQQAYFWLQEKDHAGAFNLLDRLAQYCTAEIDKGQYPQIIANRARSLLASAKRAGVDKPAALDQLKRARADADRYLLIRKGRYSAGEFWNDDDANITGLLMQAMLKQGAAPPRDQWFKPPLVSDPLTGRIIAMTLDAAWAEDSKTGIASAYKTYRGEIAPLYALANTSADPKAARKLLFNAARDHAEARIRGPNNASLKAPPSYLYNWIDPDFVAPAPAPTSPASPN
jgi:hypothetical protein